MRRLVYVLTAVFLSDCSKSLLGSIYLPNAFSPAEDMENDVVKIHYGDSHCIKKFTLNIYNRWGEKVFEAEDPSAQWDGFHKERPEDSGVFAYYLKAILYRGEEYIMQETST